MKDLVYKEQGGGSSGSVVVECELGEVKREGVSCSGRGLGNRSLPLQCRQTNKRSNMQ